MSAWVTVGFVGSFSQSPAVALRLRCRKGPKPRVLYRIPERWAAFRLCTRLKFCLKEEWHCLRLESHGKTIISPLPQRKSFFGVEDSVRGEDEADKAACERSETADHVLRRLTSEFFEHLHESLETSLLYSLENEKLSRWRSKKSSVPQLQRCSLCLRLLEMKFLLPCKSSSQLGLRQT